uniref:MAP3K7 C-terminal-like protein n=1 Tax=Geotrypetes seraphini TaxID=260995 RepID=A0A6P8RUX6_GEOSA|nr:MAP3K7 C-terminal-like protein [Geotrypetes seraphini]
MISTARLPAAQPIRIAFRVDDSTEDNPENTFPLELPDLEKQLQPHPPCHISKESMQLFKQHCRIAKEYQEVKKEITLLEQRKQELIAKLEQAEKENVEEKAVKLGLEYKELTEENQSLSLAYS